MLATIQLHVTSASLLLFQVEFSSLDFLLHTRALLSTINYLNNVLPPQLAAAPDRDSRKQVARSNPGRTGKFPLPATGVSLVLCGDRKCLCSASKGAKDGTVFSFKLFAVLGCFHVEVCDDRRSIADIRVQGKYR